ncbi:hypothetical protein [Portibacter lacus]|uniref:Uncharacterized protein n=1 Tax=Portibacter lacus TaxID=1099794 RepID=A0AA37WE82_9BACT|nr:hypothetical protein [Portibacter lacus]GLR17653.1 hypothetical protein GCM10007940_22680 [Portibacter lacus]
MGLKKIAWQIELVSLIITGVLVAIVLVPIFKNVPNFQYLTYNVVAIATFFTLIRYIFLLRYTPFARFAPLKIIFVFLAIPLFIYLMDGLSEFQNQLDEEGTYSMVSHLTTSKQIPLSKYIRSEMIFFGVGALITTFILPFRMIISIWRVRNRNTI